MGKVIFFDVDGTLVNFRGQMPQSARSALKRAQDRGHQIVLCSGRSRVQIYPWLLELGFDGIVAATGAYVEYGGEVVHRHFMSEDEIRMVTALLDEAEACYSAQAGSRMITSAAHRDRQLARFRELADDEMIEQIWQYVELADRMDVYEDIEKLVYYESKMTVQEIRKRLSGLCDVTESSFETAQNDSGEITCIGINKAFGMQKYLVHTGAARADTIAFGDGPNDLDMVEYASIGVAMGNAVQALKDKADFITKDIDEDGIAYALEQLELI